MCQHAVDRVRMDCQKSASRCQPQQCYWQYLPVIHGIWEAVAAATKAVRRASAKMQAMGSGGRWWLKSKSVVESVERMDQGQFERAEELHVVVLERQRKILGDVHLATRWTRHRLALTYRKLGKLQDAEKLESLLEHQEAQNQLHFFSH
ncbi:hypothetical protein B0H13DRAFT_1926315 [Mycena leptocephala]|nr:hypothetical protein B0H13DRAFT_1926315 [Mycena leptocephala]